MKIAIVHDFLVRFGGAEKLVQAWAERFPDAPIYTLFFDYKKMSKHIPKGNFPSVKARIRTSYLQKWYRLSGGRYTWMLALMPKAIESFDLAEFDQILSSSAAFSHGIITNIEQKHVCYVHSPMRWAWDWHFNFMKERKMGALSRAVFRWICKRLRQWDVASAGRPDVLLAASSVIKERISKYWRQESSVLHPFVDLDVFKISKNFNVGKPITGDDQILDQKSKNSKEYYLVVSQLVPYKKIELAIEACGELGLNLKVVGDGMARNDLAKVANKFTSEEDKKFKTSKVEFLGAKYGQELVEIFQNAKGFIFPSVDDFGMAPVEAMACGISVIAFRDGGALDWMKDGETGLFFEEQNVKSLKKALEKFENSQKLKISKEKIREHAKNFSKEKHLQKLSEYL